MLKRTKRFENLANMGRTNYTFTHNHSSPLVIPKGVNLNDGVRYVKEYVTNSYFQGCCQDYCVC